MPGVLIPQPVREGQPFVVKVRSGTELDAALSLTVADVWKFIEDDIRAAVEDTRSPHIYLNRRLSMSPLPLASLFPTQRDVVEWSAPAEEVIEFVHKAFDAGITVVARDFDDHRGLTRRSAAGRGELLGVPQRASAFLVKAGAPPGASHSDGYPVGVLQVTESKRWPVSSFGVNTVSPGVEADLLAPMVHTYELGRGDFLHLPAGYTHEPKSEGSGDVLHLTYAESQEVTYAARKMLRDMLAGELFGNGTVASADVLERRHGIRNLPDYSPANFREVYAYQESIAAVYRFMSNNAERCPETSKWWRGEQALNRNFGPLLFDAYADTQTAERAPRFLQLAL